MAVQCIESPDGSTGFVRLMPDEERERRFSNLRRAMQQEGHAALVVCGRSDLRFRGRVLYVSDVFQFTADCFVVAGMTGRPVFISTPIVGLGQAQLTSWAREFRSNTATG